MRNLPGKFLHFALIPALFAGCIFVPGPATAATITDVSGDTSGVDDGAGSLPPTDLTGWFGDFNPSNEWTDAGNIATLDAWLAAAEGLGSPSSAGLETTSATEVAITPEPATLGLLGIALAILTLYVPLRKSHRSLRN